MTDKLFPDDYAESVAPGRLAAFLMSDAGVRGWASLDSLSDAIGPAVNLKKYCAGDGVTVDTAGFDAACTVAEALSVAPHVYVPAGCEFVIDGAVVITSSYVRFFGEGTLTFKGAGQIQLGDGSHVVSHCEFKDVRIKVDATSSVQAPIATVNTGRTIFKQVIWVDIKTSAIDHQQGVLVLRHCDTSMVAGGGASVIYAHFGSGHGGAIFIQGGRFNSADHAAKMLIDHGGAGELDGCVLMGVNTASLDCVYKCTMTSGGHLANFVVIGGLFDGPDQRAFWFAPGAGSSIADVFIGGGAKINGNGGSSSTADVAQITFDLSSGATHEDKPFIVDDITMVNARRRAIEILGGTYKRVVVSRVKIAQYGMSANAASRAIYIAATAAFDSLEIADNALSTTYAHDYGIEIATGATATNKKVQGNSHAGTAATKAGINTEAFRERRQVLQQDTTWYVDKAAGSDSNSGLASGDAFATMQAAWDAIARCDLNNFNATLQVADASGGSKYTAGITATKVPIGAGNITIQGNVTTWANCEIGTTSADCFFFPTTMQAAVTIQGFKLGTTTSGRCIRVTGRLTVTFNKIEFGAAATQHLNATNAGALIVAATSAAYTISGNATNHVSTQGFGKVLLTGAAVTFSGTPAFTNFITASLSSVTQVSGMTWIGSFTGGKAAATGNSVIDNGGAANIPGTTGPTTATGGQYL